MKAPKYWIVVADQAHSEFWSRDSRNGPLVSLFTLDSEDGVRKTSELISDRGGRAFDSQGRGRHTMTSETDPRAHAAEAFATRIAARINDGRRRGDFERLVLVAAPRFLGLLRKALASGGGVPASLEIDKNVTGQGAAAVEKLLAARG